MKRAAHSTKDGRAPGAWGQRLLAGPALLLLAACAGAPESAAPADGAAPAKEGAPRPSVLLISIDTLRADHLGAYGYPRPTSPGLDRLAARGARFADVLTQSTSTLSSHKSLFAATLPSAHRNTLEGRPSLVERFQAAGYDTAAFVDGGFLRRRFGHQPGFDLYVDDLAAPAPRGARPVADRQGGGFAAILPAARAWVEEQAGSPYFLFIHTYDVHCPYEPPAEYARLFLPADAPVADLAGMCGRSDFRDQVLSEALVSTVRDLYDAGIRYADQELDRFLEDLGAAGRLENTLVVVISDHGESLGERGWIGHNLLHGPQLLVPWIMAGPGVPAGTVVRAPAQLADVGPTLLDLAGLPPLPATAGTSLAPALTGGEPVPGHRLRVCETKTARALLQGPWVLIQRPSDGEPLFLYRRDTDPEARQDLLADQPGVAAEMLAAWRELAAELGIGAGELPQDHDPGEMDEETRRQLRTLGYID